MYCPPLSFSFSTNSVFQLNLFSFPFLIRSLISHFTLYLNWFLHDYLHEGVGALWSAIYLYRYFRLSSILYWWPHSDQPFVSLLKYYFYKHFKIYLHYNIIHTSSRDSYETNFRDRFECRDNETPKTYPY